MVEGPDPSLRNSASPNTEDQSLRRPEGTVYTGTYAEALLGSAYFTPLFADHVDPETT